MILSMTGYGTGSAREGDTTVSVEVKTVNHRFLDLHVRTARDCQFLEPEVQRAVRARISRGRVDVGVTVQNSGAGGFRVRTDMVRRYLGAVDRLRDEFQLEGELDLRALLTLPGVLETEDGVSPEAGPLLELTGRSLEEALGHVLEMRRREGEALRADMLGNLDSIEANTLPIGRLSRDDAAGYLKALQERIAKLLPQGVGDPQRLAQEAALIADRADIGEEVTRMHSHIGQFRRLVDGGEKPGKKLDFLIQEMQREANTILSKSGNLEVTGLGIAVKTDVEKLREQVQNVE